MSDQNAPVLSVPGFWSKTSWIQIGYGVWVNQLLLCLGLSFGFSAVALPQLTQEFNTTLDEEAFFVSVVTLITPIGCIISGWTIDWIGRRYTLMVSGIPYIVGWAFIGFAKKSTDLIIGRTIIGFGIGMCTPPVRTFCAEISLPYIRGVIGTLPTQSIALGLTIQAILGALLKWRTLCYIGLCYSGVIMIFNFFLPESPYYILMTGNLEKTKNNLRKFRAKDYDIDAELETLRQYKEKKEFHKLNWKEYFRRLSLPSSYKPFTICVIYLAFGQLSGVTAFTFYAVDMQKNANSSVDPYIGNIVFGATRFFSGLFLMIFIVKWPRRYLAIISAAVLAAVCVSLGIFVLVNKQPTVVPLVGFTIYVISFSFGYATLAPMLLFELIPLEVRGLLGGFAIALLNLMMFGVNSAYPYLRLYLGFPQTIILFGIASFLATIYLYFFLPETKDLSLQQIEDRFKSHKATVEIHNDSKTN